MKISPLIMTNDSMSPKDVLSSAPPYGARRGAVLVLAIVLVLLMTLVAITVATTTTSELSISSNTDSGRKAFIQADSAARMSVAISRILLFPYYGPIEDFLDDSGTIAVDVNKADFNLALMRWSLDEDVNRSQDRYLRAGGRTTGISLTGGDVATPLITFRRKDPSDSSKTRVVATSAVTLDFSEEDLTGTSFEQGSYNSQATGKRTIIIISTDGRVPIGADLASSEEGAFFDGSADTTHAIITTAFQEVQ
ncbi:MAG: hypothetical protein LBE31_05120 [Deltaproteobacteria bacterium]|jgi:hypothetical protein|nr:hypothetical protein [Deltaproteobacteria bacterium]